MWAGGASVDELGGALTGFSLKNKDGKKKKVSQTNWSTKAPILGGAISRKNSKMYLGLTNGEIVVFDLELQKFEEKSGIAAQPGRFDLGFLVMDEEENGGEEGKERRRKKKKKRKEGDF